MSNIAIKFENISKQYRLGVVGTGTLSHDLNRWWHTIRGKEDPYLKVGQVNDRSAKADSEYVWALRDINFEVEQGDVVGIIGKNGAGKSTLLKILSRVTSPTTGSIKAKGRIASLLEVGTGFHPELTGRENIYMNGAIMGMTKAEISRKLDEIVDFAGVEMYIDTPTKRYSSGMTVRLGFAIAAHLEPEILVVDEVLAVGDAEFQKKAIGKMQDVSRGEGRTVLFVSHQLNSIRSLCSNTVLLKDGTIDSIGETEGIIQKYLKEYDVKSSHIWLNTKEQVDFSEFTALKMASVNSELQSQPTFSNDQKIGILIEGDCLTVKHNFTYGFAVYDNSSGTLLFWSNNKDNLPNESIDMEVGTNKVVMWIEPHMLNEGEYRVELMTSIHFMEWLYKPETNAPKIQFNIKGGLSKSPFWQEWRPGLFAPINKYERI